MKKVSTFFISTLFNLVLFNVFAQTPTASIATWKNNAKGAYSIVHDDYGLAGADGIWKYADTIANNRGIKFVFGAYTQLCETRFVQPNGYANLYSYAKNVMMAQHGHEIANHSYSHACAADVGWSPCQFGQGQSGWGETPLGNDLDLEINTAHNSIVNGTGFVPKYYVYPYDVFTNATNQRLEDLGYLGSRTGWSSKASEDFLQGYHRDGYEDSDTFNFYPNSNGFFRNGVEVFNDNDAKLGWQDQLIELNNEIDSVIEFNEYANREFHNVGNSGWGHVKVEAYRGHMDYLKEKVEAGDLWVGTVSEIFTYQLQKLKFSPLVTYNNESNQISISWNSINPQYNVNPGNILDELVIKSPITLVINTDDLTGSFEITQNGEIIESRSNNGQLLIDIYPHEGDLIINNDPTGNTSPYIENNIPDQVLVSNFNSYQINLTNTFGDDQTTDGNLSYTVKGNNHIEIEIENGVATISSTQDWAGIETINFTVEDEGGLTITEEVLFIVNGTENQTAFNGPHIIPGRLEAEDFDEGDEGEAYQEVTTSWDPMPNTNPYRSNHPVDIGEFQTGEFGIGFTQTGEWLEYTISVTKTGTYDLTFRTSQVETFGVPKGKLKILLSSEEIIPEVTSSFTPHWTNYTDILVSDIHLSKGNHVLRVEFTQGSINFDYIDIELINEEPKIENTLNNYTVPKNFASFTINLKNTFEDNETIDEDLIFSVSGNSNIDININNGIATISSLLDRTGVEVVTFEATDEGGLSKEEIVSFDVSLINSSKTINKNEFKLFPNPTNGSLTVSGDVNTLEVFGVHGNSIIQVESNFVNLSEVPSGIYFIQINNGGAHYKVIKQ